MLIRLTRVTGHGEKFSPILVNPDHIITVTATAPEGSRLTLSATRGGDTLHSERVAESLEEIEALLGPIGDDDAPSASQMIG